MSSASDSITEGTVLHSYRLVERLGGAAQTWLAEDTRNGNNVAVKILSRLLPKDKTARDGALKQIRLKAAIGHPGIANIIQIDIDQDVLWMASELVEGESLGKHAQRQKATRQDFLRYAWQMADILAAVHSGGVILGQITDESWIITPDNDVKLAGFRLSSFIGKHESGPTLLSAIKPTHLREAAFLSPEQVSGKLVTSKTDIFALGVCLYELIEGRLPFQGASVADVAHAVVTASPAAPTNAAIDRVLLGPIGKCIHKNPDNRYEKIAMLKDDLAKVAPDIDAIARRRGVTSPGGIPLPKRQAATAIETFIVVAELPYHDLLQRKDPAQASRLENTMQQYLGEAVYLFDGKVLDSLGAMMVASLPDGASAIKAAQKGLADLVEHNMTHGDEPVEARMLVHYGELIPSAGKPEGSGLTTAVSVLEAMEPLQLLVSKPAIDRVDVEGEPVPIGRLAEIDFYQPPKLREPEPERPAPTAVTAAAAGGSPEAVASTPVPIPPRKDKKGLTMAIVGVVAIMVLLGGVVGAVLVLKKSGTTPTAPVGQAPRPVDSTPAVPTIDPNTVYFAGFRIEPGTPAIEGEPETIDSALAEEPSPETGEPVAPEVLISTDDVALDAIGANLRSLAVHALGLDPLLVLASEPVDGVRTIEGRLSRTENGVVLAPFVIQGDEELRGEAIVVVNPEAAALAYLRETWRLLGRDLVFLPADDVAIESYLRARSLQDKGELQKALESIDTLTAEQLDFAAGVGLRVNLLLALGRNDDAIEAAKRLALLDPKNTEIRHRLADWEFSRGNPGYGLIWLGEVLQAEPDNVEVLTRIGQYAVAVGNEEKFNAVLRRLKPLAIKNPRLSAGDIVLARGRLDAAAKAYYKDLDTQPDNPILALKVGRLAVLRRSDSITQAELERLQGLQAPFELTMMQAYIDASAGNVDGAELELRRAEELADPLDPFSTASAEVYLLLNRQGQVRDALQKMVERAEPSHEYILSNPIFGYLATDPTFRSVMQAISEQRTRIAAALDTIEL